MKFHLYQNNFKDESRVSHVCLNPKHLHHFVAEVVDHLHGDAAGFWFFERPGGVAVERFPGFLVDFCFEGRPEGFVRVIGAEEIGVAYEEALLVVIGIDEPAGDAVGAVTADLAGVGVEHVDAMNGDLRVVISGQWRVDSDLISALSI